MDSEEKLILLFRQGDDEAVAHLAKHYGPQVYRLARCLLRSQEEAQDAAGDVFVKLYSRREEVPLQGFKPWLMRVVYNHCHDLLRRRQTFSRLLPRLFRMSPADQYNGGDEALEGADRKLIVEEALNLLPEQEKTALVLRFYTDMNYEEIANVMGVSTATVGTWLHRGKARMRVILEQRG